MTDRGVEGVGRGKERGSDELLRQVRSGHKRRGGGLAAHS